MKRREWLAVTGLGLSSWLLPGCRESSAPPASLPDALMRFPGKVPLRVLNDRPPDLETPWRYFREDLTPNDAFYVRWHLQMIPTAIDVRTWRLRLGGHVRQPLELSLDELRRMPSASVVAVNQCSGDSRSLFEPRLPGAQWGNGAMGNARWTGVRLGDLLVRAGLKRGAKEVSFRGLDRGGVNSIPDFVKSLPVSIAQQERILVAYEMNGAPLPMLNGFPLRLVVPGWFATYWIKSLSEITVHKHSYDGFWMRGAYRIPASGNGYETPDRLAQHTIPIHRMRIRSFIVVPEKDAQVPVGRPCEVNGIAFDGGDGIARVEFSADGGASWQETTLGPDLGRYSFRRWRPRAPWQPSERGEYRLQVRAISTTHETQTATALWNRAGYLRNVIEEVRVTAV